LQKDIERALDSIKMPDINLDSIKNELLDVVEELMANMRIPSMADHLGGAVSSISANEADENGSRFRLKPGNFTT
jgi:hypothetical protein